MRRPEVPGKEGLGTKVELELKSPSVPLFQRGNFSSAAFTPL
jgi:hypothetical protein